MVLKKKFTVAIPAYKARFLDECIQSILSQTYPYFELIIVDDNSPENLQKIVARYSDPRIQYFKNKRNCGAVNVVDNWNICLSYATGEFFILMGDDDKFEPNFLEEILILINKYPHLDVFHCRTCVIDSNSEPLWITPSWPEYESVYENIWHRMKEYRHQFISDFVYRRETLVNNGGFYKLPLAWASDDISSFIAMEKKGIAHTQLVLFLYRESSITITKSSKENIKLLSINQEKDWYNSFIQSNCPDNKIDRIYFENIKNYKDIYFQKKRIFILSQSFEKRFFNIGYFIKRRRKYNITIPEIIYASILALKHFYINRKNKK